MMVKIDTGGRCVRSSGGVEGGCCCWGDLSGLCFYAMFPGFCVCCLFLVAMNEYCRY
ncbi:hypothetical protein BDP55DRAFT_651318 [Colletotrichum godetiae]|uniref:Transmembrane protein n=1 Tax=Colletotrichum godetiae TaxID=1209918 RepID=A0AAJ0F1P9_9PEZI|nr:uncharacterized protein BDP55DRAFT_651318 [Colletotrichum godetiae]KAK1689712.1 hypothetical protein BDP55DRAFT_651318 [Colletotrichum godetiae]